MIAVAFAFLLMQQLAALPSETPAADPSPAASLPEWAKVDPFAFERACCSALVRGDTPLDVCQTRVRRLLADSLGDDLPATMRAAGSLDDCQRLRDAAGGSPYAVQCGARPPSMAASNVPVERDCRSRPERGGFTTECRPVGSTDEGGGLKLTLFGDKD